MTISDERICPLWMLSSELAVDMSLKGTKALHIYSALVSEEATINTI